MNTHTTKSHILIFRKLPNSREIQEKLEKNLRKPEKPGKPWKALEKTIKRGKLRYNFLYFAGNFLNGF